MDCLTEIYEPEWPDQEQIPVKAATMDLLWEDLCHKLNDQVTIPLSTYLSQFSEIRVGIFNHELDRLGVFPPYFFLYLRYLAIFLFVLGYFQLRIFSRVLHCKMTLR